MSQLRELTGMGTSKTLPFSFKAAAVVVAGFGFLTVFSGGMALFGPSNVKERLGDIVGFVLWFNFLAGFAYVIAGAGLFYGKLWATRLSAIIATTTILVLVAFGIHAASGGAYEVRTAMALPFRAAVWLVMSFAAVRQTGWR